MNMTSQALKEEAGPGPALAGRKILIIVENLPLPFDRRVWQEALTLRAAGAQVSIICPKGKGFEKSYEELEGIHIYRHPLPIEASSPLGYLGEYGIALFWETVLAWKIFFKHGFDVIQACNPPDLIFLVALQFKVLGRKFIFDHHDINPELFEAKFYRRGLLWKAVVLLERLTFKAADVVISTNNSFREIARTRGGKREEDLFVVRSGPDLDRFRVVPPDPSLKNGRRFLVGYVGVMGEQEGIDVLLEAVRHIVRERGRKDVQFCLAGGGSSVKALRKLSEDMGLADYVTFTGPLYGHKLFELLSTMDIGVSPDRVNAMNDKSTMNKIIEYMAFSKASVQFELTEGRYSAGEASLYAEPDDSVDLGDKILELLADPDRAARMGRLGRERVEGALSWSHQVGPLIAAYRRALAK